MADDGVAESDPEGEPPVRQGAEGQRFLSQGHGMAGLDRLHAGPDPDAVHLS
jgi:hypothetical protein